jgi:beta-exotoxin I transport system permease protein
MSVVTVRQQATTAPVRRSPPDGRTGLRAIVRRGLRDRRRAVLTWGGSLGALGALEAAIYPSVQSSIEDVAKNYPAGLKAAFGINEMNTIEGYIHAEMFSLIVPLAIAFFAIRAVAGAVVSTEEDGRLDTILALPLSRTVLLVGSYLVAVLVSAAILAALGAMTFIAGRIAGTHISPGLTAAGAFGVWPLAAIFAGAAALGAGALHKSRTVTGITVGTLIAMYAIDVAGQLAHGLSWIRWASVFRYYGAPMRDGIDVLAFIGLTAVGVLLLAAGTVLFKRRDVLH